MTKKLFDLTNKVVIITGATGLLGRKHTEAVASCGAHPVLLDLDQDTIDDFVLQIKKKYSVNPTGFAIDISNEADVKNCADKIFKIYDKIDALINNAANNPKVEDTGNLNFSRLENFTLKSWNDDIAVGLTGSFLCCKYFGSLIARNSNGGCIVNISSDLGLIAPDQRLYMREGLPDCQQNVKPVTYSVIKSGLIGLTRYMSTYWPQKNVRCNAICPGGVENGQPDSFLNDINFRIPLGRMAKADEYQSTVVWMISDSSSYLNGSIIAVDGGRTTW